MGYERYLGKVSLSGPDVVNLYVLYQETKDKIIEMLEEYTTNQNKPEFGEIDELIEEIKRCSPFDDNPLLSTCESDYDLFHDFIMELSERFPLFQKHFEKLIKLNAEAKVNLSKEK